MLYMGMHVRLWLASPDDITGRSHPPSVSATLSRAVAAVLGGASTAQHYHRHQQHHYDNQKECTHCCSGVEAEPNRSGRVWRLFGTLWRLL